MSDVIGRGVIEVVADARKFKAGIEDAKKSIKDLGASQTSTSAAASRSIDNYVSRLQLQAATIGKSKDETELFKLAARGASDAQIAAAASALRLTEAHKQSAVAIDQLKTGFIALSVAAGVGIIAAAVAFDHLAKSAAEFQHMAEKTGDTAENMASLAVAAAVGGTTMDAVTSSAIKLSKNLTGVDDESKAAGAAVAALGIDLEDLKAQSSSERFVTIAKALDGFAESNQKSAVAVALLGKAGAEQLPFFHELAGATGLQKILTSEQIELAKQYHDRQAALKEQISLYASAIVTEMLPAYGDLAGAMLDVIKGIAGVKDGAHGLGESTEIQDFAEHGADSLAFLIDAGDGVVRVFQLLTTSLGTLIAADQLLRNALAHPFSGAFKDLAALPATVDAAMQSILQRPTFSSLLADRRAARKAGGETGHLTPPHDKPELDFAGALKKGKDTASQEAKAQLAYDLEQIKKASEVTIGAYANADKILQAMRAAGLIEDQEYYASKLEFIRLNSAAQEDALLLEIDRLQREKLAGKDKIDNDRKIADAEAKLAKVRADAVANVQVNSIQEAAALRATAQGYRDAEIAAQEYLAVITRTQDRELAGMGAGTIERSRTAGRAQIEDKYSGELKALNNNRIKGEFAGTFGPEAKKKYDDELDRIRRFQVLALGEYDTYYAARLQKETDWTVGADEAMKNYYTESRNIAQQTEQLFTNAFKNMEDALVGFVKTGKLDFKSLADSIITDLIRIQVRKALGDAVASAGGSGGWVSSVGKFFGMGGMAEAEITASSDSALSAVGALGTLATGTDYVSRTGLYQLHKGEAVLTASENAGEKMMSVTNVFHISGATDRRTQAQIAASAGEGVSRAMARNT